MKKICRIDQWLVTQSNVPAYLAPFMPVLLANSTKVFVRSLAHPEWESAHWSKATFLILRGTVCLHHSGKPGRTQVQQAHTDVLASFSFREE